MHPFVFAPTFYGPGWTSIPRAIGTSVLRTPNLSVARSMRLKLSGLDHAASHSLCTLRSRRHRRTTQHSVPADRYSLPGGVDLH